MVEGRYHLNSNIFWTVKFLGKVDISYENEGQVDTVSINTDRLCGLVLRNWTVQYGYYRTIKNNRFTGF